MGVSRKIDAKNQRESESDIKFQNSISEIQRGIDAQIAEYKRIYAESSEEDKQVVGLEIQDLEKKKEWLSRLDKDFAVKKGSNWWPSNWGSLNETDSQEAYTKHLVKMMNDAFKADLSATNKVRGVYEYTRKAAEFDPSYISKPEPAPAPSPEPEPAATPAAKPAPATTGRVTAAMKPAEFKPNYLKEETPKTEEEYLGKDPRNWKTMSKWERAAAAIGMIGDMGEDVIDVIAASRGLEHNGAKKLREAREKLQRDKEERRAQYREYLDKIEAENRRIREFNAGIGNQLAFQQFQADNEYNRQLNLLNEQARINRENGLYNTPL